MGELINELKKHHRNDIYPFHMPGHKRIPNWIENPYLLDITEITEFDNLYNPTGIIKRLLKRLENVYKCKNIFLSFNGSTGAILTAISAVVDSNDRILIARNCHKSVYNGVFLRKCKVDYIYPQIDTKTGINLDISPEKVDNILKNNNYKALVITSPTYEGVISDISKIAQIAHKYGVLLIVDAAHGAHIGINEGKTCAQMGADIVVMSLHKTLPCFTQTAVLCVENDTLIDKIQQYFEIFETTSPSYLFMSGVEACLDYIEEEKDFFKKNQMLLEFRKSLSNMNNLKLFEPSSLYDTSKIVITTCELSITGVHLKDLLLKEHNIELEMSSLNYALAMTSCMDTQEGYNRFKEALYIIDSALCRRDNAQILCDTLTSHVYEPWECEKKKKIYVNLEDANGQICGTYVYAYPPGIPILVPGEVINDNIINQLKTLYSCGCTLRGLSENLRIEIIKG